MRDRLDGGSSDAETKRLKSDVKRLADQNTKLTKELSAFDIVSAATPSKSTEAPLPVPVLSHNRSRTPANSPTLFYLDSSARRISLRKLRT